jgi:hypothetical protein
MHIAAVFQGKYPACAGIIDQKSISLRSNTSFFHETLFDVPQVPRMIL